MMSQVDKEYHKRFNNQQLPTDDFDMDGLWNDIEEDLSNDPVAHGVWKPKVWWVFGIVFLFVLGGGLGIILLEPINRENQPNDVEGSSFEIKETVSIADLKTVIPALENEKHDANCEESDIAGKSTTIINEDHNVETKTLGIKTNTTFHAVGQFDDIASKQGRVLNDNLAKAEQPFSNEKKEGGDDPVVIASSNENSSSQTVVALSTENYFLEINDPFLSIQNPVEYIALGHKKNKPISWRIGVFSGMNKTHFSYQSKENSALADMKQQTEKGEIGVNVGWNTTMVWKKKWLVSSGITYHQVWSKFNLDKETISQVLKENQLIKIWTDVATGDTIKRVYGDALIDVLTTRKVVHYNNTKQFSIPLELGIQKEIGKIAFGVSAGTVFNFTISQTGKTFDKDGVITVFDSESITTPLKTFSLGGSLTSFVNYQLSDHWSISISPQWRWQRNAKFDNTTLRVDAHQFSLNLGLGYDFY